MAGATVRDGKGKFGREGWARRTVRRAVLPGEGESGPFDELVSITASALHARVDELGAKAEIDRGFGGWFG